MRTFWHMARAAAALGWAAFTAWLFVYDMPLSGLHALLGVWALWPSRAASGPSAARVIAAVAIVGAAVVSVPVIGLPEYAATTNRLHCRTLGFTGKPASSDCDPDEVARGARAARQNAPLFTARERLGVHGFNHVLALGGLAAGLPEVAWETAAMSWTPNPLPADAPVDVRRAQCRASYGDAASRRAALGDPEVVASDFPMRSGRVRTAVARGVKRLSAREGARRAHGKIHFAGSGTDNAAYTKALVNDSARVALALEVGDSRLDLARRADGDVDVTWTGTIHYPGEDIAFAATIPTLWGPRVVRVSETVFCGMQIDGAMNPFVLTYRWNVNDDDARLWRDPGVSDRGLVESAAWAVAMAAQ